jgi:acyl dehydratase
MTGVTQLLSALEQGDPHAASRLLPRAHDEPRKLEEVRMPQRVLDGVVELQGLVGQEVGVSDWFTLTQERINTFAEVTEDRQWIHCDVKRARSESPYGTTIAHGFLTLSLLGHLLSQAVQVRGPFSRRINYGLNRVRFPAAVPAGARIRARCALQAVEEIPGGLQIAWVVTVECEGQPKPVMVAESLSRLYSETA